METLLWLHLDVGLGQSQDYALISLGIGRDFYPGIQPTIPDFQADQTSRSPTVLFRALFWLLMLL